MSERVAVHGDKEKDLESSWLLPGSGGWWVHDELCGLVRERLAGSGVDDGAAAEQEVWRRVHSRLRERRAREETDGGSEMARGRVRGLVLGKVRDVVAEWHRKAERRRGLLRRAAGGPVGEGGEREGEDEWAQLVVEGRRRLLEESDPVVAAEGNEEVRLLRRGLLELDERTRLAVWAWGNQIKEERVAARLGVSVRTVYTLREQGIERLRDYFRRNGYEVPKRRAGRRSALG